MEYVIREEQWFGGIAIGFIWSRIVCSVKNEEASQLSGTSTFAETITSFSTISQEKRHEELPSWLLPFRLKEVNY